jgi:hypothetical protein
VKSVHGRAATATFAQAALSYLENGGNKRFLDKVLDHLGTMPLAKIDLDAIEHGGRRVYPNASDATRNRQFFTAVSAVLRHAAIRKMCAPVIIERCAKVADGVVSVDLADDGFGGAEHPSHRPGRDASLQHQRRAGVLEHMRRDLWPTQPFSRALAQARRSCELIGSPSYSITYCVDSRRQRHRCGISRGGMGDGVRR